MSDISFHDDGEESVSAMPLCLTPGCPRLGTKCRGLCCRCFQSFRAQCVANGTWADKKLRAAALEKLIHPEAPKWEWEGDEGALIAMQEQKERE